MIDEVLLQMLICPACRSEVSLDAQNHKIVCAGCGKRYPIREGIPIMLIEAGESPEGQQ